MIIEARDYSYLGFSINSQVSVPDELRRVERTKTFENWRRWFTEDDVDTLKSDLSPYLHRLGYDAVAKKNYARAAVYFGRVAKNATTVQERYRGRYQEASCYRILFFLF